MRSLSIFTCLGLSLSLITTSCSDIKASSSSTLDEAFLPCPSVGDATCTMRSPENELFIRYSMTARWLGKNIAQITPDFTISQPLDFAIAASIPALVIDIESRHQEWKSCGWGGLDKCREWVNDGRSPVNVILELLIDGVVVERHGVEYREFSASSWSADRSYINNAAHGMLTFLPQQDLVNLIPGSGDLIDDVLHPGRPLHKQARVNVGKQQLSFSQRVPAGTHSISMRAMRQNGKGTARFDSITIDMYR